MSTKIKAGIIGSAGYTGGETARILLNHPHVELAFMQSRSQEGKFLHEVHSDLIGETSLKFASSHDPNVDVVFLCLSHGESKKFLAENRFSASTKVIDLGNDFRLGDSVAGRNFVYGLPEFQREKIKTASNIANPGCFATAIQLGLLPLAKAGVLGEVNSVGITGSTGAGQKLQDTTHFTWRANNISAYKTLTHQHLGEINQTLKSLQVTFKSNVNFVPWRGDFTRGIFVSSIVDSEKTLNELIQLYKDFYSTHPFTHVADSMIDLKQVVNNNKCLLFLEKQESKLVVHSALDNLLKGASGQAVQNMNLLFAFEETAGLKLKSIAF
ncbi:MAG TPA: N-acetyl-gamma-glutamyl-phosphate reductase [Cyclobacteriaceae bacterium]|jgi:N-acetyl-gamma-glutamyl-phosphate reductase|nr:N-acetyl-gamma-glutamyl-phosphate reductase [Cyclobacteriaceae bacterium]